MQVGEFRNRWMMKRSRVLALCEACLYLSKSNKVRKNVEREFQSISLYFSSKMNLWQMVKLNRTAKHFQK